MTTCYTTMFGAYDDLRSQAEQSIDVEWVAVVDKAPAEVPRPWNVVEANLDIMTPLRNNLGDHSPRMQSKWYKTHPWIVTDDPDVVFIDSNMQVTSPTFIEEALTYRSDGFATWEHPDRDSIFAEAQASLDLAPKKYAAHPVLQQVEHYRQCGYNDELGLYATGSIAYDTSMSIVRHLGFRWFAEQEQWTYQDQLSLPYVCWSIGLLPGVFPHRQIRSAPGFGNPWLQILPHLRDD